jgi:hypothetical protein
MSGQGTYFYFGGKQVSNQDGILPISLYKGMEVTLEGYKEKFQVADWNYHHGHKDKEGGLRIILEST